MPKPPKQLLMEGTYAGDLEVDVRAWIAEGATWREMAKLVSARSQYSISHESLRLWYRADAEQFAKVSKTAKARANIPLAGLDVDAADKLKTA